MEGFDAEGFDAEGFVVTALAYEYKDPFGLLRTGRKPNVLVAVKTRERQRDPGAVPGYAGEHVFTVNATHFGPDDPVSPFLSPHALITGELSLRQGFDPGIEGDADQISTGDVDLTDRNETISNVVANTHVDGEEVLFYLGPDGAPRDEYVLVGRARAREWVADLSESGTRTLTLRLEDLQSQLDISVQKATFGGTGGLDGRPSQQGQRKPLLVGRRVHLEPVLIDPLGPIHMVSSGPITPNDGYIDGVEVPSSGDYLTYEALLAADIPEGTFATCRALGLVRPRPVGYPNTAYTFTMDVTGYGVTLVGDVMRTLLVEFADQPETRVGSFRAAQFVEGGYYYPGGTDDPTVHDAVRGLASDVFGRFVTAPSYDLVLFRDPRLEPPEVTLEQEAVLSMRMIGRTAPIYTAFEVRYAPNDRVLTEAEIADAVEDEAGSLLRQRGFRAIERTDQEALSDHPTAISRYTRETSLIGEAGASQVLERLRQYGSVERVAWEISYRLDRLPVSPGQIAFLQRDGDAFWGVGRTCLVYDIQPDITNNRVLIGVIAGISAEALRTPAGEFDPAEFDFDQFRTTIYREFSDEFDPEQFA